MLLHSEDVEEKLEEPRFKFDTLSRGMVQRLRPRELSAYFIPLTDPFNVLSSCVEQ